MNAKDEIVDLLSDGIERRSLTILASMKFRGMWFAEARVYPALRTLERDGTVLVRVAAGPDLRAVRGGRPAFWYRLARTT